MAQTRVSRQANCAKQADGKQWVLAEFHFWQIQMSFQRSSCCSQQKQKLRISTTRYARENQTLVIDRPILDSHDHSA